MDDLGVPLFQETSIWSNQVIMRWYGTQRNRWIFTPSRWSCSWACHRMLLHVGYHLGSLLLTLRRFDLQEGKFIIFWLVLWSINFIFPFILGISSSQLTNSYFSVGWPNHQPVFYHTFRSNMWRESRRKRAELITLKRTKIRGAGSRNISDPLVSEQFANLKMAIEIVDLPIRNGDFP